MHEYRNRSRRGATSFALAGLAFAAALLGGTARSASLPHSEALGEALVGQIGRATIQVDSLERGYLLYAPAMLAERPGLVLTFHGSGGEGARLRGLIGESLERLADRYGFLVVYPDGYGGNWNDCRARAPFAANRLGVDDVGFVRALVEKLVRERGVDPAQVRALGYSNGGHMAYRLALEAPDAVPAIAAFAASLPVEEDLACRAVGRPVGVMVVTGSEDRVNPYRGGEVLLPGGENYGRVRSAEESAAHFAAAAGNPPALDSAARAEVLGEAEGLRVERRAWERPGAPAVVLYTVYGGGHTIPGARALFPPELGALEPRFDAVAEAIRFFFGEPGGETGDRRIF